MKIASFNANGIRARLHIVREWLLKEKPNILCLQETKVQDSEFPQKAFEELGYFLAFRGEKGYNGVAILSKTPLTDVFFGFGDGDKRKMRG
jgi:exodeoxyribonuclease-3